MRNCPRLNQTDGTIPECLYNQLVEQRENLISKVKDQATNDIAKKLRIETNSYNQSTWLYSRMRYIATKYVKETYARTTQTPPPHS